MTTLYPTKTCFDDVNEILLRLKAAFGKKVTVDNLFIIHAVVSFNGKKCAHAWVEFQKKRYEIKLLNDERIMVQFDTPPRIYESHIYTIKEALALSNASGLSGPWVESVKKYCSDQ